MQVMEVQLSLYIPAVWSGLLMLVLRIDGYCVSTVNASIRPHESMCWPEPLLIAPERVATYFFLFLNKKTCCGYSLEAPWRF